MNVFHSVYLHDWADTELNGIMADFKVSEADLEGAEILLASYTYEDYSGRAFVLFQRDGKLYEINGSHCSCYGLEDQWGPEETSVEALEHRIIKGSLGSYHEFGEFSSELEKVLSRLKEART